MVLRAAIVGEDSMRWRIMSKFDCMVQSGDNNLLKLAHANLHGRVLWKHGQWIWLWCHMQQFVSLHENTNDISNTSKSKDSRRMYLYMIDTFVEACFQEVKPSLLQSNWRVKWASSFSLRIIIVSLIILIPLLNQHETLCCPKTHPQS
jgi:hypothetical protein